MIYLVTQQTSLFPNEQYGIMTVKDAIAEISTWDRVQFDTETKGRNPHLCAVLTAQFGNKAKNIQIVVDVTTIDLLLFKEILETKLIIGHNLKFDIQFLYKYNIIPTKIWDTMIIEQLLYLGYDNRFFRYALDAVAERRLQIKIDKTVRGEIIWRGLDTEVILYAAGDVVHLEDIADQQMQECEKKDCVIAAKIENAFVPVIAYLEWCGIKLDEDKWKAKMAKDRELLEDRRAALNAFVSNMAMEKESAEEYMTEKFIWKEDCYGRIKTHKLPDDAVVVRDLGAVYSANDCTTYYGWEIKRKFVFAEKDLQGDLFSGFDETPKCKINWDSPKQVIAFCKYLGFDTKTQDKETGEDKDSVVEKLLKTQKGVNDEFLDLYFAYKESAKECSTYGDVYLNAINPVTGRIHTKFKQLGAASGRMSCGGGVKDFDTDLAAYKHISANKCKFVQLQNLPADEDTRGAFVPEAGNLMCSCDYSALESRLGADIYNEPAMIEEYLHGSGDIHSLTAKACFPKELAGIEVKDIKDKRPDLRKRAKPVEFSQQFGGSARAIQNALACTLQEAKDIATAYNEGFKGIAEFKRKGSAFVRSHGYIVICRFTGHKLYWEDFKKWQAIERLPEYVRQCEYSKDELKEHNMAASKWDRLALNAPTQGTGIICLKLAMTSYFKWIVNNGLFNKVLICDLVHDEAVVEAPKEIAENAFNMLKACMEKATAILCPKLPIPANAEIGDHWIH